MQRIQRARRGFTLVELLVVIGIIALLLSVLLPVLSGVSRRGRDIKCQSNLRQCVQLFFTYAAENKGQLPYGLYYNLGDSALPPAGGNTWGPLTSDERLTTCFSIISRMSSKHYTGDDIFTNPDAVKNSAPFLLCPEAQQVLQHLCSYVTSFVAFPTPYDDRRIVAYPKPIQDKPTKTDDLLPFSALIWDTAVVPGMATDVGYVTGADIDGQRFWVQGAGSPQIRFYTIKDPFARVGNGSFGQTRPVGMDTASFKWYNIDPRPISSAGFNIYPYQGNLRFRHNKETTCNVGFADGSVRQFTVKLNADKSPKSHDAIRHHFMIKWPNGMGLQVNPSLPF